MPTSKSIIDLNVNIGGPTVTGATFDKLMFIAPHVRYTDRVRTYVDLAGVLADFPPNDPVYEAAAQAFAQESLEGEKLGVFKVGTKQVDEIPMFIYNVIDTGDVLTIDVGETTGNAKVTVNTTIFTSTEQDELAMAADFVTKINGSAEPVTAADNLDGTFTVTADVADTPFYMSCNDTLDFVNASYYVKTIDTKYATTSGSASTAANIAANLTAANGLLGGVKDWGTFDDSAGNGAFTIDRNLAHGDFLIDVVYTLTTTVIIPATACGRDDTFMLEPSVGETMTETIQNIRDIDDDWIGLCTLDVTDATVLETAGVIETLEKFYGVADQSSDALAATTVDIGALLQALNYDQTFVDYNTPADQYNDVAMMAEGLPNTPGTRTWYGKERTGVTALELSSTQELNLANKNINALLQVTDLGVGVTFNGTMADGTFIDIIHFKFYLQSILRTGLAAYVISAPRIPYTNEGMTALRAKIIELFKPFIEQDQSLAPILDDPKSRSLIISIPRVEDQTAQDRADRIVRNITVRAQYAGAAHTFEITINVGI